MRLSTVIGSRLHVSSIAANLWNTETPVFSAERLLKKGGALERISISSDSHFNLLGAEAAIAAPRRAEEVVQPRVACVAVLLFVFGAVVP